MKYREAADRTVTVAGVASAAAVAATKLYALLKPYAHTPVTYLTRTAAQQL